MFYIYILLPLNSNMTIIFSYFTLVQQTANITKLALMKKYNKIFNISYI